MHEINYSPYDAVSSDEIPKHILDLIEHNYPNLFDYLENSTVLIHNVESPFILAENEFDLCEANNQIYACGVDKIKTVSFTGGNFYMEYKKVDDLAFIIQGNEEEGFNIFILS
jgi:hypothetical protein